MPQYIKRLNETPDIPLDKYVQAAEGNYQKGRNAMGYGYEGVQMQPDTIVIHVADGSYLGTVRWFAMEECSVSAHFTVSMKGQLAQSVFERDTAFHSGKYLMNIRSFGIEHEGRPSLGPWTPSDAMYQTSARLTAYLCFRYNIPVNRKHIIGHHEVDPKRAARRNCPGPTWDWDRYIRMVKGEYEKLATVASEAPFPPAHEKHPDDRRQVNLTNPDGTTVGTGTLISGTDKVYLKDISLTRVKILADRKGGRSVRLFNGKTNKQVGLGTYYADTRKVYIVSLNYSD